MPQGYVVRAVAVFVYFFSMSMSCSLAFAGSYVVQRGDQLSSLAQAIQEQYPDQRIYGPHGILQRIIDANPSIPIPDLILPGQEVNIPYDFRKGSKRDVDPPRAPASLKEGPPEPILIPSADLLPKGGRDSDLDMSVSIDFGARFLGYQQSKALGGIEGSVLSFNAYSVKGDLRSDPWFAGFSYSSFSFDLGTSVGNPALTQRKELRSADFILGYQYFYLGMTAQTRPLFRYDASNGSMNWADLTLHSGLLGARFQREISTKKAKPAYWESSLQVRLPLSSSASSGVSADHINGFGASLESRAMKSLVVSDTCKLYLGFGLGFHYDTSHLKAIWGSSQGEIDQSLKQAAGKIIFDLRF